MLEIISSLSPYALNLLIVSIFTLLWVCFIYICVRSFISLTGAKLRVIHYWRSFWLCALCVISLPFFLAQWLDLSAARLIPELSYDLVLPAAVPDLNQNESPVAENRTLTLNSVDAFAACWMILYVGGVFLSLLLMLRKQYRLANELGISGEVVFNKQVVGDLLCRSQYDYLAKNNIEVIFTKAKCSPFVFGLINLKLVLPSYLMSMDAREKSLVIEHELTHIKRRDPILIMSVHILGCFLWFAPFIRWFKEQFLWAVELSCDRQVLRRSASGSGKIYARAMLRTLRQCAETASYKGGVAFSTFDTISQVSFFKRRMINIMDASHGGTPPEKLKLGVLRVSLIFFTLLFTVGGVLVNPGLSAASPDGGGWIVPIKNARVSSQFGDLSSIRKNPHRGTDFAAALGTVIVAPAGGVIVVSTDHYKHKNYGKIIIIDHGDNSQTLYSHLDSREVEVGQKVKAGQKIGTVGVSGKVTGPHLHFELIEHGERVNPEHLLSLWFG
ncbi:M23/M56 family metallopeptidase [uncultured Microbulbifer sp.]|uniref:M23/M56 family metallopeptidase n=1 Tax=uncultured Microbulbifer sp. TaxID=348147 RepID=UPI00262BED28|nr:M23/M56 family metallopeptidase [uncultured Microbulbifer sp.]